VAIKKDISIYDTNNNENLSKSTEMMALLGIQQDLDINEESIKNDNNYNTDDNEILLESDALFKLNLEFYLCNVRNTIIYEMIE